MRARFPGSLLRLLALPSGKLPVEDQKRGGIILGELQLLDDCLGALFSSSTCSSMNQWSVTRVA